MLCERSSFSETRSVNIGPGQQTIFLFPSEPVLKSIKPNSFFFLHLSGHAFGAAQCSLEIQSRVGVSVATFQVYTFAFSLSPWPISR